MVKDIKFSGYFFSHRKQKFGVLDTSRVDNKVYVVQSKDLVDSTIWTVKIFQVNEKRKIMAYPSHSYLKVLSIILLKVHLLLDCKIQIPLLNKQKFVLVRTLFIL